jgi:hypothetical protein
MTAEATTGRQILRELPRKEVALLLLVVAVNVACVVGWRGCVVEHKRGLSNSLCSWPTCPCIGFVPPWNWTAQDCRETWPWM